MDAARAEIVTQPSVRASNLWTPAHLRMAQTLADNGDMWRLGDLCDQILGDERFGELLEKLAGSVIGCELTYEKDARSTVGISKYSEQLAEDWPTGWCEEELLQYIIWQQLVGVSFGHHDHWLQADSGRIVPKFRAWHPKHFSYSDMEGTWKARQRLAGSNQPGPLLPIAKGDGEWVIMTRRGDFRPWAHGLWRGLSRWWMLKQYAISDWGVHSEKGSKLLLLAPEGVSAGDRRALAQDIFAMAKDATISLPAGFSMQLIETTANTRDIYLAQIDAADMAAAIAILGQNLTSRVDGGSLAATEGHERTENRRVRYVGRALGRTLFTQSLPWWTEYNFGDRKDTPYPHYQTDPPEDKAAKVETLGVLADALTKLHQAGYRLPLDRIEDEYGVVLEELTPDEKAMVATGAAPGAKPPPTPALPLGAAPKALPIGAPRPRPKLVEKLVLSDGDLDDEEEPTMAAGGATPPGFVAGQEYVDRVTGKTAAHASDALTAFADRLINAIDRAESPAAVSKAVLQVFSDEEDPERLRELVQNAITLAELGGRHAVNEET